MKGESKAERLFRVAPKLNQREIRGIDDTFKHYIFRVGANREVWTTCCKEHRVISKTEMTDLECLVLDAPHQAEDYRQVVYNGGWAHYEDAKKQNGKVTCPYCGRSATVKEVGRSGKRKNLTSWKRGVVFRWYRSALWATVFWAKKEYMDNLNGLMERREIAVYRFAPGKAQAADKGYNGYWMASKRSPSHEPFTNDSEYGMGYDIVYMDEVDKSPFKWCQLREYMKSSSRVIGFLNLCTQYPRQVEMLMKAGLWRAVRDMVQYGKKNAACFKWEEPNTFKSFGLSKEEMSEFLAGDKDLTILAQYKRLRKRGLCQGFGKMEELVRATGLHETKKIADRMVKHGITAARMHNYLEREKVEQRLEGAGLAARYWMDYLDAADLLGYDLGNSVLLMPKGLRRKHDTATDAARAIHAERVRVKEAAKMQEMAEKYEKKMKRMAERYTYSDGRWLIRVPTSGDEIVAEGRALRHCVGGYAMRHLEGKLTILFLRERDKPGVPFTTIEMGGEKLRQIHGAGNRELRRAEYQDFVDGWLAWVESGSKRDKKGRPITKKTNKTERRTA